MPPWLLHSIQLLCVVSIIAGIAMIFVPAAYIAGGVLVALICEAPVLERRK